MVQENTTHLRFMTEDQARRVRLSKKHSRTQANRQKKWQARINKAIAEGGDVRAALETAPPSEAEKILRGEVDELLAIVDDLIKLHQSREQRLADSEHKRRELGRGRGSL